MTMKVLNRRVRSFLQSIIRYAKYLLFVSDFVIFNFSFLFALFVRFGTTNFPFAEGYLRVLLLGNLIWVLLIGVFNTHRVIRFEPVERSLIRVIKLIFTHFILLVLITYVVDFRDTSRLVLLYYLAVVLILNLGFRILFVQILKFFRRRGINHKNVAIVGYNANAVELQQSLTDDISYGYRISGFYTDESKETTGDSRIAGG